MTLVEQQREVAVANIDAEPFVKDVEGRRRGGEGVLRRQPGRVPDARRGEVRVRGAHARRARRAGRGDAGRGEGAVRRQRSSSTRRTSSGRRAHILIAVKPDASDADKAAAKKKAEDLAAQAKANPAKFAELAKKYSRGPGLGGAGRRSRQQSARHDGQGVRRRRVRDEARRDRRAGAVGIRLARDQAARHHAGEGRCRSTRRRRRSRADLKRQKVAQKFAAAADQFQNLVYEQADSLAGVAKALDLEAKTSRLGDACRRAAARVRQREVRRRRCSPRNRWRRSATPRRSRWAPNTLMAGRVVEYKPAAPRPFDDVKDEIRRQLAQREASEMAQKAGREKLALLEQGKSDKEAGVDVRQAGERAAQPDAAGLLAGRAGARSSASMPRSCRSTPARPTSAEASRSTRVQKVMLPPTANDPAKLAAARRPDRRHAEPRALRRVHRSAQGEGRRADQPGEPGEEVDARRWEAPCERNGRNARHRGAAVAMLARRVSRGQPAAALAASSRTRAARAPGASSLSSDRPARPFR